MAGLEYSEPAIFLYSNFIIGIKHSTPNIQYSIFIISAYSTFF